MRERIWFYMLMALALFLPVQSIADVYKAKPGTGWSLLTDQGGGYSEVFSIGADGSVGDLTGLNLSPLTPYTPSATTRPTIGGTEASHQFFQTNGQQILWSGIYQDLDGFKYGIPSVYGARLDIVPRSTTTDGLFSFTTTNVNTAGVGDTVTGFTTLFSIAKEKVTSNVPVSLGVLGDVSSEHNVYGDALVVQSGNNARRVDQQDHPGSCIHFTLSLGSFSLTNRALGTSFFWFSGLILTSALSKRLSRSMMVLMVLHCPSTSSLSTVMT